MAGLLDLTCYVFEMIKDLAVKRAYVGEDGIAIPEDAIHPGVDRELLRTMLVDEYDPVEYTDWSLDDPYGNGVGVDMYGETSVGITFRWW